MARGALAALAALALAGAAAAAPGRAIGCPATPPSRLASPGWEPARRALVPPGAASLLLCRYRGVIAGHTARRAVLVRAAAARAELAGSFDELHPFPALVRHLPFACPAINPGQWLLAIFGYARGQRVSVLVQLSPVTCRSATNGAVTRRASSSLLRRLEALVPSP